MPKPQKRRVRSNCWYFYTKTDDGGLCNMCKKEVRSTGNTTNLLNHLKRRHTVQYTEYLRNPENFAADDGNRSDNDEDMGDQDHDEIAEASQILEENNQSHSMEAFHADQGGTVIWLQSQEGQQNGYQPQITIVQHSVPENGEGGQQEGETILGTGEIVTSDASPSENGLNTPEPPKTITTDTPPLRKPTMQKNAVVKMPTKFNRSQFSQSRPQSFSNPNNHLRMVSSSTDTTNQVNREDSFDAFGKYIASLLRNLPSKKAACRLQKDIVWLALQEQMRSEHC